MPRWKARTWWILGLLLLLQLGAAVGFRAWASHRDIGRWEEYQAHCRSRGEDLGIKAWLPPEVPDDDNVFTHPWVIAFLASESSPQAEVVGKLQPWPGLALDGYEEPAEGKSWFDGREAEASAVVEAGKDRADHFKEIHEAAGRAGCQPPLDFSGSYETLSGPWTRVAALGPMLAVRAEAAIVSGDALAATLEDQFEKAPPAGIKAKLEVWWNPPGRRIATNSFHFCKLLEPTLANSDSRTSWEDFDRTIRRMSKEEPTPTHGIAKTIYVLIGEFGPYFDQEDKLDLLRQHLAE